MAPVKPSEYIFTLAFPISLHVANTFSTLNAWFDNKYFTNPSPIPLFAPVTNTEHILYKSIELSSFKVCTFNYITKKSITMELKPFQTMFTDNGFSFFLRQTPLHNTDELSFLSISPIFPSIFITILLYNTICLIITYSLLRNQELLNYIIIIY